MTLIQVWGCLLIFVLCPVLGGLPIAEWLISRLPTTQFFNLKTLITGSVEASKGVASVALARYYFPMDATWWLIALIALLFGQFGLRKSKQIWGVAAGCLTYSWQITFLMVLIGGIGLTLLRERRLGRIGLWVLFPIVVGLHSQQGAQVLAAIGLSSLFVWMDDQFPDVSPSSVSQDQALMTVSAANDAHLFGFFRRDRNIRTLNHPLKADQVGQMAATLSQLKALGQNVPPSWVLPPGDDANPLIQLLNPSPEQPLMIRSSVIGAVQLDADPPPEPIYQITSRRALAQVIGACRTAYSITPASPRSHDRGVAVIVQVQIKGQLSGLAWRQSTPNGDSTVVITGGPGATPAEALMHPSTQQIQVSIPEEAHAYALSPTQPLPSQLVQKIVSITQAVENHCSGIPQRIEWSDDGSTLWVLAVSPHKTAYA
ncbi:hypothetical protein [Acaryochloris sp. IP29b_bin.137]|uniref:hypothetical protein n=1 Tax=Acaryochloris sp. IP29b_bin.137 TaxID=2969217 RepID=UPI0026280C3C|nr:hypothetical protein [Acaryochloris sp. IP29b_bin.137]